MKDRLFSILGIPLGIIGVMALTAGAVCAEDGMATVETFGGLTAIESDDLVGQRGRGVKVCPLLNRQLLSSEII